MNMPDTNYNNLPQRIICFNITKSFVNGREKIFMSAYENTGDFQNQKLYKLNCVLQ